MQRHGRKLPTETCYPLEPLQPTSGDFSVSYDQFINRYGHILTKWSKKLTSSPEDADDLYQETAIKIFKHFDKWDDQRNTSSWIVQIMKRVRLDQIRATSRRVSTVSYHNYACVLDGDTTNVVWPQFTDQSPSAEDIVNRELEIALAVSKLNDRQRGIVMKMLEGKTVIDLVSDSGLHISTIRAQLCKIRKTVRETHMKAFDVATDVTGHAHDIQALGFMAVGAYMRFDRCTKTMVNGLHSVGIKLFSIYERGNPTQASYFTSAQALQDGMAAVTAAKTLGQPQGTPIFFAFDFDATLDEINGPCLQYMQIVQRICKQHGYLAGAYGSGLLLKTYQDAGYIHCGFLAQSAGWDGRNEYMPHAAIVQGSSVSVLGFDVDLDDVKDVTVLW